jgi:hypothetical protein
MSLRVPLIILVLCAAAVAVIVLNPRAKEGVVGILHSVKKDIGPAPPPTTIGDQVKVYVPRGSEYYHTRDCPRVDGLNAVPMPLDQAQELYKPCPECNPPT